MALEVFDQKSSKRLISGLPFIAIQANGAIRLNKAAALHLAGVDRVILLWDRKDHKLAIASASTDDVRAYGVSHEGGGAKITPRAFLGFIGFSAVSTVSVPTEFVGGMLQATLPAENLPSENTPRSKDDSAQKGPRARKRKPEL